MQLPKILRYHKDKKSEEFQELVHNEALPKADLPTEVTTLLILRMSCIRRKMYNEKILLLHAFNGGHMAQHQLL